MQRDAQQGSATVQNCSQLYTVRSRTVRKGKASDLVGNKNAKLGIFLSGLYPSRGAIQEADGGKVLFFNINTSRRAHFLTSTPSKEGSTPQTAPYSRKKLVNTLLSLRERCHAASPSLDKASPSVPFQLGTCLHQTITLPLTTATVFNQG